jgi:hypothetical protein
MMVLVTYVESGMDYKQSFEKSVLEGSEKATRVRVNDSQSKFHEGI